MAKTIVLDLGLIDYGEAWMLQKKLVRFKAEGHDHNSYLLLLEHPHTYTVGRKGNTSNILRPEVNVIRVERGGDVTYHGPGQLVCYPIMDLTQTSMTVRDYVRALEKTVVLALEKFCLPAYTIDGKTGVWVADKKIASVGVAVEKWVTYHGVALNVNTELEYFEAINPCGFSSKVMTSMEKQLGKKISINTVKHAFTQAFSCVMQTSVVNVQEGRLYATQSEKLVDQGRAA